MEENYDGYGDLLFNSAQTRLSKWRDKARKFKTFNGWVIQVIFQKNFRVNKNYQGGLLLARKIGCIWILNGLFHVGKRYILNKNQKIRFLSLKILLKSSQVLYLQHKCQTDASKVLSNVWVIKEEYWKILFFQTIEGDLFKICIAPVLVCTKVVQTVGGGDNISGAGLNVQIWSHKFRAIFHRCSFRSPLVSGQLTVAKWENHRYCRSP